ncbi:MAG: Hsp20/alpha crystallin family protein [Promethearchaeota archaeon]
MSESKEIEKEEKEIKTEIEKKEDTPVKLRAFPQIYTFTNEEGNGYDIEIYLPGVEKETIELKMNKDYITVSGETETVRYTGSYELCCPIEPEKAISTYKEGLLKIHVPFKEVEMHTVNVKIE